MLTLNCTAVQIISNLKMDQHEKLVFVLFCIFRDRGTKSFSNALFNNKDLTLSDALSNENVESVPENPIIHATLRHTATGFVIDIILLQKKITTINKKAKALETRKETIYLSRSVCFCSVFISASPLTPVDVL